MSSHIDRLNASQSRATAMAPAIKMDCELFLRWVMCHALIAVLACCIGTIHYYHASTMFENDRNFSQISALEREMSLRTEMGFYYSFYKTLVEEQHPITGIVKLVYNRLVEYPDEVNAINRFNIYPEILLGAIYHYYNRWRVDVLEPIFFYLEAVWWCAGATLSAVFLSAVTLCGNTWGGLLAVLQYLMNHAEATRVQWAPNERENFAQPFLLAQMALVTAQLRRPEREANALGLQTTILTLNCICLLFWQFSQFILLTQLAIAFIMEQLCIISSRRLMLLLHSHFCGLHLTVMLTQGNDMLLTSAYTAFFAVLSVYTLLLSSLRVRSIENRTDFLIETWLVLLRVSIVVTASLWVKSSVAEFLGYEEDSHVFDILYSKFSSYKTFHTLLYTCSATFAFLPMNYFTKITLTGLLPLVGFGISNVLHYWMFADKKNPKRDKPVDKRKSKGESGDDSGIETVETKRNTRRRRKKLSAEKKETDDLDTEDESIEKQAIRVAEKDVDKSSALEITRDDIEYENTDLIKAKATEATKKMSEKTKVKKKYDLWMRYVRSVDIDAGIFYNIAQTFVFGCMAIIIMRLKLLFTPHLCIVASLATSTTFYNRVIKRYKAPFMCIAVVFVAIAVYHGHQNIEEERSFYGDFYDPQLEELLRWISERTAPDAVLAGPMPLMAATLLSTRRPVVLHPHYEHASLRQRTYAVYKMYGRFPPAELHADLSKWRVTHLVLDVNKCYGRSANGCSFGEIWDHEAPHLRGQTLLCHRLLNDDVQHFYKVFENEQYAVFRVHDYRLIYTPRLQHT